MAKNDYAIVIGINCYDEEANKLTAPAHDACDFKEWLIAPEGGAVPEDQVYCFAWSNQKDQPKCAHSTCSCQNDAIPPKRDDVVNKFYEIAEKSWEKGTDIRRIYLFFAGHSININHYQDAFIFPEKKGDFQLTFGTTEAADFLRNFARCEEMILIADCCRNNPLQYMLNNHFDEKKWDKQSVALDIGRKSTRAFYLYAAKRGTEAFEVCNKELGRKHGVFSAALNKAFRFGYDEDGNLNSDNLFSYLDFKFDLLRLIPESKIKNEKQEFDIDPYGGDVPDKSKSMDFYQGKKVEKQEVTFEYKYWPGEDRPEEEPIQMLEAVISSTLLKKETRLIINSTDDSMVALMPGIYYLYFPKLDRQILFMVMRDAYASNIVIKMDEKKEEIELYLYQKERDEYALIRAANVADKTEASHEFSVIRHVPAKQL